jgi:hypothetical protein
LELIKLLLVSELAQETLKWERVMEDGLKARRISDFY